MMYQSHFGFCQAPFTLTPNTALFHALPPHLEAIQTVLAACKEYHVACGVTAGVDDIAARLEQGFRVIIVTDPAALEVGREAAGRTGTE